ncbi:MAG: amino acid adenylation domain-containing protein [Anaerolineales bacterium]|nr:amino acid adenylation domain-containing protein [Anaerolineales bacterium]
MNEELADQTKSDSGQILERLFQAAVAGSGSPIQRRDRSHDQPLSFGQQRFWFLDQLEPGNPVYHIARAFSLQGELNLEALQDSINILVARHEVLRTRFPNWQGQPSQVISPQLEVPLTLVDLSRLSSDQQPQALEQEARQYIHASFDLSQLPLIRLVLFQLCPQEHVLLLVMHHIISDGWSISLVLNELLQHYAGFLAGKSHGAPALPVQYADYARWQQDWQTSQAYQHRLQYWRERLARRYQAVEIPADFARPLMQTFKAARLSFNLNHELTEALDQLAHRSQVSLFMLLQAACAVLLYRYTHQENVTLGTATANRNRAEIQNLIGFFVNTLVLQTDLNPDMTFEQLLQQVKESTLQAFENQDFPFEKLVDELQPERDLSRTPLFQVFIQLRNYPQPSMHAGSLRIRDYHLPVWNNQFDLSIEFIRRGENLQCDLIYNTGLYQANRIERMQSHLHTLLTAIVQDPHQAVSKLDVLTTRERQQVTVDFVQTDRPSPQLTQPVHQVITSQARLHPSHPAILAENIIITYGELNRRANQLAHYLLSMGVQRESPIGICCDRSSEMMIAFLAVLKAGCVYVPVDLDYPAGRLKFIFDDTRLAVLLAWSHQRERIPPNPAQAIFLDEQASQIGSLAESEPDITVEPEDLVYVLYTSGSTGRPKGVGMRHQAMSNLMLWKTRQIPSSEALRVLQFASLNFDVSIAEILCAWYAGGTLLLAPEAIRLEPVSLLEWIQEHQVTRLFLPYVALQQLAEATKVHQRYPSDLVEIVSTGEQLVITPAIENFFSRLHGCTLENQYGPTETHVVTAHTLVGDAQTWPKLPPIGKPIDNCQVYVLDAQRQLLPIGITGEIYLGGLALGRGYLQRPELTVERFIPNPFSTNPQARLYKTGDLGHWLPDGNLAYLGRADQQVKIRGYRVELGEIEAVLSEHPAIAKAVVVAHEGLSQGKQLVAYLVADQLPPPEPVVINQHLKTHFPDYMLPARYIFLDEIPITSNGKVDRRALPAPEQLGVIRSTQIIAPRNPVEAQIAQLWQTILGIEQIGIQDDFFDLGGHSLLATQVASRLSNHFGISIPIRLIFEQPNIAALARSVQTLQSSNVEELVSAPRVPRRRD